MSFSEELKKELAELIVKHGCCRKSLAWGILLDADHIPDTDDVSVILPDMEIAEIVRKLFSSVFGRSPTISEKNVVGRKRYMLTITSRTAANMLDQWDVGLLEPCWIECEQCTAIFMRGALIGCGMINDPLKEAHLEFRFHHPERAAILFPFLADLGTPPKPVNRKSGYGLYYKKGGVIEDLLLQCGAQQAGFSFINEKIEKEIRNTENRVTNCEARKIQKTVTASIRQISAIRQIMAIPSLWEGLPEELRVTAKLRIDHEDASLQELQHLHNPPISKSGLNHRLSKLISIANEIDT
jgi:DNA-binding protein WhiA